MNTSSNKKIVFSSEFKDNTQGFSKLQDNLDRLNKKLSVTRMGFGRIGSGIKKGFGKIKESVGIGSVFAGMGSLISLDTAAEFEDELAKVKAVVKKSTGEINKLTGEAITIPLDIKGLEELENLARKIGAGTQFSATQALEGMKLLGTSGWNNSQIKPAIKPILELTGAAQVNSDIGLAQVSGDFSDVMGAYGVASGQVKDFSDQAAWAFSNSNQTLGELMEAMKLYAPTFKKLGIAKEDALAVQMVLSDLGTKGNVAGTALAGFAARMLKLPPEAMNIIKSKMTPEEYSRFYDAKEDRVKDVMQLFALMRKKGLSNKELTTILGQESGKYMISLVDEKNINKVLEKRESLGNKDIWEDESSRLNKQFLESFRGKVKLLKSAISDLAISIGKAGLLDVMKYLADGLTTITTAIGKIPKSVLGPLTIAVTGFTSLVAGMASVRMVKRLVSFSGAFKLLGNSMNKFKVPKIAKFNLAKMLDIASVASLFKFKNLVKPLAFILKIFRFSLSGIIGAIASAFAYLGWFTYANWDKIKKVFPWIEGFLDSVTSSFKWFMERLSALGDLIQIWGSSAGSWLKNQFLGILDDPENKAGWKFNPFEVSPHQRMEEANHNHNRKEKKEKEQTEISLQLDINGLPNGSKLETKTNSGDAKFDVYLGERSVAWS